MGYNELEVELRKTLAQIARWREMGYMPTIEQGIALGRLQKIYAGLLDLPCSEPETETAISPVEWNADSDHEVIARGMAATDGKPRGRTDTHGAIAPDDESFEPCCDPETPTGGTVRETKADDDGNFADLSVREESRLSEETHLRQDDEARDLCPPPTEFTQARHATEQAPEQPRIFGIEVSPYARHEIIDTLFHGNTALFETETAKLNTMGSLEEALVYIGETYRWIPENAATIKFIDLLETRFEN